MKLAGEHDLTRGSEWDFHNATTGDVTRYLLEEWEAADTMGRMAYLRNPATDRQAKVSVRWLLGGAGYPSRWERVG
jgi:hypothetical protein